MDVVVGREEGEGDSGARTDLAQRVRTVFYSPTAFRPAFARIAIIFGASPLAG